MTVLLLVAVMAVLAATVLERLKLGTQLSIDAAATEQARAFASAGEVIARYRIGDLLQHDANRTTLEGDWAGRPTNLPIDGGLATARIDDGGNCFNLNSLVNKGPDGVLTARPGVASQFARLITLLDAGGANADAIAAATTDWIDSDSVPQSSGAEDDAYARNGSQGRTANTIMTDVSELRSIAGVTADIYSRVRPFVCALPMTDPTLLNVNTLNPAQSVLIAALSPAIDPARARAAIELRPQHGFASPDQFWSLPPLANLPAGPERAQVRGSTHWFDLTLIVELQGAELEEHALIDARDKPARIVRRSYGEPS